MVRSLTAVIGDDDPADIGFELPCQGKVTGQVFQFIASVQGPTPCLLYTSDAADEV